MNFKTENIMDPAERIESFKAEIAALKRKCEELMCCNDELKAQLEDVKCRNTELKNDAEYQFQQRRICEAQLEVVRLIFGKGGRNEY